jgi:hypothetical protein
VCAATVVVAALFAASPAVAGPPLLCHPFDIGDARSLPWDGSRSWFHGRSDYAVGNVARDTDALLTPSTPVIVRMETIRRAAIYASADREAADALYGMISARARSPKADALAVLDAALLTETFRQLSLMDRSAEHQVRARNARAIVGSSDGRALLARVIAARPDDAAVQFAAALIVADKDRAEYARFAQNARTGAGRDTLLARNLDHVS